MIVITMVTVMVMMKVKVIHKMNMIVMTMITMMMMAITMVTVMVMMKLKVYQKMKMIAIMVVQTLVVLKLILGMYCMSLNLAEPAELGRENPSSMDINAWWFCQNLKTLIDFKVIPCINGVKCCVNGIRATNLKKYNKVQYFCCILNDLPFETVWGRVLIFELCERGGSQFSGQTKGRVTFFGRFFCRNSNPSPPR